MCCYCLEMCSLSYRNNFICLIEVFCLIRCNDSYLLTLFLLFFRKLIDMIYSEGFEGEPLSEAIMNRMVKAAGHEILRI